MGGSWQNDLEAVSESATEQVLITEYKLGMTKKKVIHTHTLKQSSVNSN